MDDAVTIGQKSYRSPDLERNKVVSTHPAVWGTLGQNAAGSEGGTKRQEYWMLVSEAPIWRDLGNG